MSTGSAMYPSSTPHAAVHHSRHIERCSPATQHATPCKIRGACKKAHRSHCGFCGTAGWGTPLDATAVWALMWALMRTQLVNIAESVQVYSRS